MQQFKFIFKDGRVVIKPESNKEKFRQMFFDEIADMIPSDENGIFPDSPTAFETPGAELVKAVDGFRAENESLTKENEVLTEENESLRGRIELLQSEFEGLKKKSDEISESNAELKRENQLLKEVSKESGKTVSKENKEKEKANKPA